MKTTAILLILIIAGGCSKSRLTPDTAKIAPHNVAAEPHNDNANRVAPAHHPDYSTIGKAAWYDSDWDGTLTTNGEAADSTNLFAAHPTLPLPSYASVENLETGQILTVRVNDRSLDPTGRIITLSRRTAELLGLLRQPDAPVHVRYLSPAPLKYIGRDHP